MKVNMLNGVSSNKSWRVVVAEYAEKQLARIPRGSSDRISKIFDEMAVNPWHGDVDRIKGEEYVWRRRVGAYRIIFEVFPNEKAIFVYEINRRTSSTY